MTPEELRNIDNTWTLFLDRDGVINKRIFGGYVRNIDEFEILPGVLDSIKFFSENFGRIIVVTNQQGVGKGLMTEEDLDLVHDHLELQVANHGGRVDAILYCTDLAGTEGNCRKPSPEMATKAKQIFPDIIFEKSIMIGDSLSDIKFGANAGMKTVFSTSSEKNEEAISLADITVDDLEGFCKLMEGV